MFEQWNIGVVIPAKNEEKHIKNVINTLPSFVDKYGLEIFDPYEVYHNYTRSWRFLFDTLSLFGMQFFLEVSPYAKYF